MLYLFHGTDTARTRARAFAWIAAARAKAPEAVYLRISPEHMSAQTLAEAAAAQGLFFTKTLVLLDDPFADAASAELVLSQLPLLHASDNPIALVAPKLLAARVKKIEAAGAKVFQIDSTDKKPQRAFNSALVNALAAKDGALLWKELQKAERQGDAPEMVHGLLHWKARDLMQKGGVKWGKDGARKLSRDLIELLSDSRSGDLPLGPALERFALSL